MDLLLKFKNSPLIKDNFILFIGTMTVNILGFLFHFYVGRKLGPAEYGVFGAVLAIFFYFTILLFTIQSGIAKFSADFSSKNDSFKIAFLFKQSLKRLFVFGIIATISFLIFIPLLASFLDVEKRLLYILSLVIVFAFLLPIIRGLLQGLQRFKKLSYTLFFEGITKVLFVVILLNYGLGVDGALLAMIFAWIIPLFFGFYVLRDFLNKKEEPFETKEIYLYIVPMFLMMLMLTGFYTLDVILVKHFFNNFDAGLYTALSMIGKILFFGSISVSQVMFPKVIDAKIRNLDTKKILLKSFLMVFAFVGPGVIFYFIFSKLIVSIFYGADYLALVSLVGPFSGFIALFSFVYILSFYNIALKRYGFILLLALFVICQAFLIFNYHSSLEQIVNILIVNMFILFGILSIYTLIKKDGQSKFSISSV